MRERPIARIFAVIAVAAGFGVAGTLLFKVRPEASVGRPAPTFALESLDDPDDTVALDGGRGVPTVVNFWASWCAPCEDEAPELARVARANEGRVRFLGVNIRDGRDEARAFVARYGIGFASGRDPAGTVARSYGLTGAPETAFVDARGRLVGTYVGALDEPTLTRLVDDLVAIGPDEVLEITSSGRRRSLP